MIFECVIIQQQQMPSMPEWAPNHLLALVAQGDAIHCRDTTILAQYLPG
jgi:hypothetical protein